jgi:hypothetical protein
MRKLASILILFAATVSFSGCAWRNLGPCYGAGCPSYAVAKTAPSPSVQNTPAPKAKHQNAKDQPATVVEPQQKPGQ